MANSYQLDLFCDSEQQYKITKPIRLIEFFAGVGFQRLGISKAFPVESWKICEWAIPSILAYDIVHSDPSIKVNVPDEKSVIVDYLLKKGVSIDYNVPAERKQLERYQLEKLQQIYTAIERTHNLVNIMGVKGSDLEIADTDKYEYVLTYSFPCQDLSLAGDKKGMSVSQAEGGTRSGLVWEILRIIKESENKPQLLLMENVPQIHSKDNNSDFYYLQVELQKLGYKNFWQDMNAKNYGIPQNRNRTFMLSIYDKNADYVFPEPEPLKLRLKDLLEVSVDEKYYLSEKFLNYVTHNSSENYDRAKRFEEGLKTANEIGLANSITTRMGRGALDTYITDIITVGNAGNGHHSKDISSPEGLMPTITTGNHNNGQLIAIKNATAKGYEEATIGDGIDISSRMESHRGTVQKGMAQTLTCQGGNNVGVVVEDNLKRELCNQLIKDGKVEEGDIIKHSYTQQIMDGNQNGIITKRYKNYITWKNNKGEFNTECNRASLENDLALTIPTSDMTKVAHENNGCLRIRKLTPLECCRLMGADDSVDHKLKAAGLSDSQRYHIYGDGLVVAIPEKIFWRLKQ